jgi:hypothetical protein
MSIRRYAALAALLLTAALTGASIQRGPAQSAVVASKIAPEVAAAVDDGDSVRVIVSLAADPAAEAAGGNELRTDIAEQQSDVLRSVDNAEFTVSHQYVSVHALAGEATSAGIAELAASPAVLKVSLDLAAYGALGESGPLINADDVHN